VAVGGEAALEEADDPRLVLDDQNAHASEYTEAIR
jgi:hypothetical protein